VKPPVTIGILIVIASAIAFGVFQLNRPAPAVAFCDALPKFASVAAASITELKTEDLVVGTGETAQAGRQAVMNYIGYLPDGKSFDTSCTRGQPFQLALGAGQVIQGWEQGIPGMKVGGHRRLLIPASLGYGAQGTPGGPIPPNSPLIFDVELVAVQ
jgi:FKBP-type peptidyl-prolyl cis-trans isomerase